MITMIRACFVFNIEIDHITSFLKKRRMKKKYICQIIHEIICLNNTESIPYLDLQKKNVNRNEIKDLYN